MFTDYTALQLPFTPHMLTFTIKIHKMIQLLMSQFLISQSVRFRDQPFARPVFQYGVDEDTAKPALQLSQFKVEICSPIVGGSLPNDCLLTVDVTHISCKGRWFYLDDDRDEGSRDERRYDDEALRECSRPLNVHKKSRLVR